MFDSLTAFTVASIFSLLSGGLFASVYRSLPEDLHSSARDWIVGTLALGVCLACFAAISTQPSSWVRLAGNTLWFFGVAFYWRSIRRYYKQPDNPMVFFAAGAGTMASATFLFVLPHLSTRVGIATLLGSLPMLGAAYTLIQQQRIQKTSSGWTLSALFLVSIALLIARGVYFQNNARASSMIESKSFALSMMPILISTLPVLGTMAFLLLCFERIRSEPERDKSEAEA
jgi:hypothetical protein